MANAGISLPVIEPTAHSDSSVASATDASTVMPVEWSITL